MDKNKSSQICRACLESSEKMYPLVGSVVNVDVDIASMISYCISEKLQLDEDLPDCVCVTCFRIIRISYNFFRQFRESQEHLLQIKEGSPGNSIKLESVNNKEVDSASTIPSSSLPNSDTESKHEIDNTNFDFITVTSANDSSEESDDNGESTTENIFLQFSDDPTISNSNSEVNAIETNKMYVDVKNDSACANIYICPICKDEFSHLQKFTCHVSLHKVNKIVCDRCPVPVTLSMSNYIKHFKENHRYQCKVCSKSLTTSYGYKYHMKQHENIRNYKCPVKNCKRSYFLYHLLKKHMFSHSKTPNFNCDLCGAGFRTYDSLKYHQKTHGRKRNHFCTLCGKGFFQAVHLRDHLFIHLNLKQFTCDECGRSFTTSSQLKAHSKRRHILNGD